MGKATSSLLIGLLLCCVNPIVSAEPESKDDAEAARNEKLLSIYKEQAKAYEFTLPDRNVTLELHERPVFAWVNRAKISSPQYGAVFVWTHNGRAEVLGTVFSDGPVSNPAAHHEFHSLTTGPLRAVNKKGVYWERAEPGVEWKLFSDASQPAQTSALRLAQMRALARRFSGESIKNDDTRWQLSLLAQPLYRMDHPQPEILESAVFSFVSTAGTDPEVLLIIEARVKDEGVQWQYALCRFTDLTTQMYLDRALVWSFENESRQPYFEAGRTDRYRLTYEGRVFSNQ